jgi:hypothetical protein
MAAGRNEEACLLVGISTGGWVAARTSCQHSTRHKVTVTTVSRGLNIFLAWIMKALLTPLVTPPVSTG